VAVAHFNLSGDFQLVTHRFTFRIHALSIKGSLT
jgi:hypothetical protein